MPRQTSQSGLAARLGQKGRQAYDAHKTEEAQYGAGSDLPAGIDGGVAQLTECKFGIYQTGDMKGKDFFLAAGIVKSPATMADGTPVRGLRTQIGPEPLCDTPSRSRKTVMDHVEWVQNELKKLGADLADTDLDDLEMIVSALKEEKPHFRFRTWKGSKATDGPFKDVEPRVQHEWRGACEYVEDESDGEIVDESEPVEEAAEETEEKPAKKPAAKPVVKPKSKLAKPKVEETAESLAEAADGGDEDAQVKLVKLAEVAGVDAEACESWAAVVEAIEAANAPEVDSDEVGEGDEDASPEKEWKPEKGDTYLYKPAGKKKPVDCEVVAVFEGKRTVNLKNLDDGTSYKAIDWDSLEQ